MSETVQITYEDEQIQRSIAEARAAERVRSILGLQAEEPAPPILSIFEPGRQRAQAIYQLATEEIQ